MLIIDARSTIKSWIHKVSCSYSQIIGCSHKSFRLSPFSKMFHGGGCLFLDLVSCLVDQSWIRSLGGAFVEPCPSYQFQKSRQGSITGSLCRKDGSSFPVPMNSFVYLRGLIGEGGLSRHG